MEDFVWCDGEREMASSSYDQACFLYEAVGRGKVWRRTFSDDDLHLLEGVEDVTPEKKL